VHHRAKHRPSTVETVRAMHPTQGDKAAPDGGLLYHLECRQLGLRGFRQRRGEGRVDFDAGPVELVAFEHQPAGIDEGNIGDADEAEDVPDIRGSEIIAAVERNAAGGNDDDGLAILQQALGAGLRHPEGAARPYHLVEPCLQARRDGEVPRPQ
jgi:hypothetical protein